MKEKTWWRVLYVLIFFNFAWAFGAAYLEDFHPSMEGFKTVFISKALINTCGLIFWCVSRDDLLEESN